MDRDVEMGTRVSLSEVVYKRFQFMCIPRLTCVRCYCPQKQYETVGQFASESVTRVSCPRVSIWELCAVVYKHFQFMYAPAVHVCCHFCP